MDCRIRQIQLDIKPARLSDGIEMTRCALDGKVDWDADRLTEIAAKRLNLYPVQRSR